ncbi:MAG: Ralstonia phage RsoP1EGY [Pseudomonadota bacterium]|jgi:hypothetical protein
MDPITTTVIAAGIPILTDLVKTIGGGIARRLGGLSVDDQLKLEQATIERLKALAGLDQPGGTPSQWVVDLRAAFRYVAAGVLILIGATMALTGGLTGDAQFVDLGVQVATFPFGFIFGERMVLAMRPAGQPGNTPMVPPRPTPGA